MSDLLPQPDQDAHADAVAALGERQAKYTEEVTAFCRVAGRYGLHKKPTSMVEVGLLQLEESRHTTWALEGLLDLGRAVVRSRSTIVHTSLY